MSMRKEKLKCQPRRRKHNTREPWSHGRRMDDKFLVVHDDTCHHHDFNNAAAMELFSDARPSLCQRI